MATFNISSNHIIFGEDTVTSQPALKYVDWTQSFTGIQVSQPSSRQYELQPLESLTLFSGTRSLTVDGTTEFDLTLSALDTSVYRMTNSAGTAPGFRTTRAVAISSESVTVTVNNNATIEFALSAVSVPTFAAVVAGDTLFIPDTTTGDSASPFNVLNVGFWVVLSVTNSGAGANRKLICKRLAGEAFVGVSEVVSVTANSQFKVFSSTGVQPGDTLKILGGFSTVTRKTFVISTVTDLWVEFTSAEPLPLESDVIPTAVGLAIYSSAKSFIRVEADQEAVLRLNSDTTDNLTMSPRAPGSVSDVAHFELWGPVYQAVLINKSNSDTLKATVITVVLAS